MDDNLHPDNAGQLEEQIADLDPYNAFAYRTSNHRAKNSRKHQHNQPYSVSSPVSSPLDILDEDTPSPTLTKPKSQYHIIVHPPTPPISHVDAIPKYSSPQPSPSSLVNPPNPFAPLFPTPISALAHVEELAVPESPKGDAPSFQQGSPSQVHHPHQPSVLPPIQPPTQPQVYSQALPPVQPQVPVVIEPESPPPALQHATSMRRRPQLKLQLPPPNPNPRSAKAPTTPTSPLPPILISMQDPNYIPNRVPEMQNNLAKFNVKLTVEDSRALRSLSRGHSAYHNLDSNVNPPVKPSKTQTTTVTLRRSSSADLGEGYHSNSASPASPRNVVSADHSPKEDLTGDAHDGNGGSFRRKATSTMFSTLPQVPMESSERYRKSSGAASPTSSTIPVESGLVFPEGGGSFRRKTAGGGGSWDPSFARGLEEMEVEAPEKDTLVPFLKKALYLLLQMYFLALVCSVVIAAYLGIYAPFIIPYDLKISDDQGQYSQLTLGNRVALGMGYGFHNAFVGFFCFFLMIRVIGLRQVMFLLPFNLLLAALIWSFIFIHYYETSAYHSLRGVYPIIVEILIGIQIIGTAALYGFRKNKLKSITSFIASITVAFLIFVGILDFFGVPLYLKCSASQKSIFRISVVPCLFIIKVVLIRSLCRITERSGIYMRTDAGTFAFLVSLIPIFVRTFYGRIFFVNVPSLGNLAWNAIIVEIFDILFKLAHWNRRHLFRHVKDIEKYKVLTPLISQPRGDALYALSLSFEKCVDVIGITFATLLQFFYQMNHEWEPDPNYGLTVGSFFVLFAVQALSHLISIRLEIAHKIPIFQALRNYPLKTVCLSFCMFTMAICAICGWRGIFIIHGSGV